MSSRELISLSASRPSLPSSRRVSLPEKEETQLSSSSLRAPLSMPSLRSPTLSSLSKRPFKRQVRTRAAVLALTQGAQERLSQAIQNPKGLPTKMPLSRERQRLSHSSQPTTFSRSVSTATPPISTTRIRKMQTSTRLKDRRRNRPSSSLSNTTSSSCRITHW